MSPRQTGEYESQVPLGEEKEYTGRAMFWLLGQRILTEGREHIFLEYELEFGTRELSVAGEGI